MKEKMQQTIDAILKMADKQEKTSAVLKHVSGARPDNALSKSIRNKKEAAQFQAELDATIALGRALK